MQPIEVVISYHERTKHHLGRYARSPGFMDWANQPDPFRRYVGATLLPLAFPEERELPTYDSIFDAPPRPRPLDAASVSELFYDSLALSAWKRVRAPDGTVRARWSLRVDPSSGNLHPTEAYLISGPVDGLTRETGIYHYAPAAHGLEERRRLEGIRGLPPGHVLVGVTSIHWREAWKYGERAFRYCQHDCGHVVAALALSAARLGWTARLVDRISSAELAALLGVADQSGPDAEQPDCLLALGPEADACEQVSVTAGSGWSGRPNRLSREHRDWPVIGEVARATRSDGFQTPRTIPARETTGRADRGLSAQQIIRQRRSAVAMDAETAISSRTFFEMLERLIPAGAPFGSLSWKPAVSLALFVHRVDGLHPGLYVLVRDVSHEASLRQAMRPEFLWERPDGCPKRLPLWVLLPADVRAAARTICCHQEIAAGGAFAVAMLARFEETLHSGGAAMYPRLFWETGAIGQVLYLEAEAAGVRGTGIGCYFDDALHEVLGIQDRSWQSLYHFTVGGPVDDSRLETTGAYEDRVEDDNEW